LKAKAMSNSDTTIFTDAKGNEWDLSINLGAAERIERADFSSIIDDRKVSFFNPDQKFFSSVILDTRCIALMIWCVIKPKAEQMGIRHQRVYSKPTDGSEPTQVSPVDAVYFEDILSGDAIYKAKEGFWNACTVFFRGQGISIKLLTDSLKSVQTEALKAQMEIQPKLIADLKSQINKAVNEIKTEMELEQAGIASS
jgi:hypothetical protein